MIFRNSCSIIGVVDVIIENSNCDIFYICWFDIFLCKIKYEAICCIICFDMEA